MAKCQACTIQLWPKAGSEAQMNRLLFSAWAHQKREEEKENKMKITQNNTTAPSSHQLPTLRITAPPSPPSPSQAAPAPRRTNKPARMTARRHIWRARSGSSLAGKLGSHFASFGSKKADVPCAQEAPFRPQTRQLPASSRAQSSAES